MNLSVSTSASSTIQTLTTRNIIPAYIFWELTRQCNLNCAHCYVKKEKRKEISFKEISFVIKRLKSMKALVINFSGGEVFLRKDFFKVASYAKKNNFAIKIFTNGTLISTREAKEIKKLKPLCVEVSIYSKIPSIHDAITGVKGSWKKSLKAVDYLRKNDLRVKIKCSIIKENFPAFKETVKFIKKMGLPYQFNPVLMPRQNGDSDILKHGLSKEERGFVVRNLSGGLKGKVGREQKLRTSMCSAGINSLTINTYGDVMPCIAFPVKLGNILQEDIGKIWLKNKFLLEIRKIKNKDIQQCNRCEYLEFCSRCPGIAFLKTGDYKLPYEEACQLADIKKGIINNPQKL